MRARGIARPRGRAARTALALLGAASARAALELVRSRPAAATLERTNFRGGTVTLAAGPALAIAASTTAALGATSVPAAAAALTAGLGSGAVGLYDDIAGARPEQKSAKGFAGHLAALRQGRVTSGLVKIAGVGAASLAASAMLGADRGRGRARRATAVDVLLGAGVIAGTANLVNLLDLRPGRALKAGGLLGATLAGTRDGALVAGPLGAAAALLPGDLAEETMLGDAGANALGALLGVGLAARAGRGGRIALLAALVGLTAASERVSFTAVIERTPVLRELDALGRRRPPAPVSGPAAGPAAGRAADPGPATGPAAGRAADPGPAAGPAADPDPLRDPDAAPDILTGKPVVPAAATRDLGEAGQQ